MRAAATAAGLVAAAAAGERDGEEALRDARAVGRHVLRNIAGRIHSTSKEHFRRRVKYRGEINPWAKYSVPVLF